MLVPTATYFASNFLIYNSNDQSVLISNSNDTIYFEVVVFIKHHT